MTEVPVTQPGPTWTWHGLQMNRLIAAGIAVVVVFLMGWTAYLALSLPGRYEARNWTALWVGFDVALGVVISYAAWAAWRRRRIMVVTALVAGTLLMCDAWFDVVTSFGNRDGWLTLLTALGAEIPLALFFFWVARRILCGIVASIHALGDRHGPTPRLRDAPTLHALEPVDAGRVSSDRKAS